jgi:hypothetical protein
MDERRTARGLLFRGHMNTRIALALVLFAGCAVDESPTAADRSGGAYTGASAADPVTGGFHDDGPMVGWTPLMPGAQCATHTDCDSAEGAGDGFCYRGDMGGSLIFPDEGYCTIDDGTGSVCATDDDCPGTSQCINADGYHLCLPACGEDETCPTGQACMTEFGGLAIDAPSCLPGNASAVDGDACNGFYDCGPNSECWNDIEHPGGMCSAYGCKLVTNVGCNGGICIPFEEGPSTGTVCVASCTDDSECRDGEGYVCYDPDGAGLAAGYCRHPHVGDACADAADCGGEGWSCLTDGWGDGYCSQSGCPTPGTIEGCSPGAVCATVGSENICVDRCPVIDSTATCRDGYTCAAVGAVNGGGCLATLAE